MHRLSIPPEHLGNWHGGLWRPWYGALWAEAAVLSGDDEAPGRVRRARALTAGNSVAEAVVDRADALLTKDDEGLATAAAALEAAGCRYEWARTLVLLGGTERARGESALAAMGATAPAVPR
jgi:hypothetical protein